MFRLLRKLPGWTGFAAWVVLVISVTYACTARAQQLPDVATLQRAITILQQRRNAAMDALANCDVQRAALAEEVAKLKAEIEKLKKPDTGPTPGKTDVHPNPPQMKGAFDDAVKCGPVPLDSPTSPGKLPMAAAIRSPTINLISERSKNGRSRLIFRN
jgi:hypothetical protein